MEASLIDMTRGLELYSPTFSAAFDVEIEVLRDAADDDGEYDVIVEYVFERAPIEDAFADPWFAVHEDALAAGEELPVTPIATRQSLHAVLGFAVAVAVATFLYAATL
jgi:hypothetical protein